MNKVFSKFGPVKECNILKREDGKLVGCAFVQYDKVNHAAKAIHHANGKEISGRQVIIDWAVNQKKFSQHVREQKQQQNPKVKVKSEDGTEDMEIKEESEDEYDEPNEDENGTDADSDEESDGEDDENEGSENGEDEDKDEKKHIHQKSNDVAEGCTVFIKNIPFEATKDDLYKVCRQFGPLYYAVITVDKVSGHSKGNGFAKYKVKIFLFNFLNFFPEILLRLV